MSVSHLALLPKHRKYLRVKSCWKKRVDKAGHEFRAFSPAGTPSMNFASNLMCGCPEQPGDWVEVGRFFADVTVLLGKWSEHMW